jgi:hypothetical protein
LTEKVQLILQLLHPYTFIPTSTVIREIKVSKTKKALGYITLPVAMVNVNVEVDVDRAFSRYTETYLKQSHYREVLRWDIFMEQELRFGLDLGRMANFPDFIASKSFHL